MMNDLNYIKRKLEKIPRVNLISLPTPLEKLDNLAGKLEGPDVYLKRDDIIGGNKMRKLEFLMADALQKKKRKIITFGSVESNHTREVSVVCNKLGLKSIIFVTKEKEIKKQGNYLLNRILGAEIKILDPLKPGPAEKGGPSTIDQLSRALIEKIPDSLRKDDYYIIPVGGYVALGSVGYLLAALEMYDQCKRKNINIDYVVTAVGTTGTFTGLLYGLSLINKIENRNIKLLGISVTGPQKKSYGSIIKRCDKIGSMVGYPAGIEKKDIKIIDNYQPGYGIPSSGAVEAIKLVARKEGLILDAVYTGKALDGLIKCISSNMFKKSSSIVFIHTGGFPSLFSFSRYF
ncbi:MAG: pyridoxal-phosphate dependent enzyme [Candidatus Humimicrobiaceae bacterium]